MENVKNIRVLLVDDHQIVLEGIQLMLNHTEGVSCVGTCSSGKAALSFLHEHETDTILLDIEMPDWNGIQTCIQIKKLFPKVKVIALTMMLERSVIQSMLEAGADGFLIKNASQDELINAIQQVHVGKTYYSEEVREKIMSKSSSSDEPSLPKLSRREKEILNLIVNEKKTSEIAEMLFISNGTVETHRRNMMRKLGAKNMVGMVRIALENGMI